MHRRASWVQTQWPDLRQARGNKLVSVFIRFSIGGVFFFFFKKKKKPILPSYFLQICWPLCEGTRTGISRRVSNIYIYVCVCVCVWKSGFVVLNLFFSRKLTFGVGKIDDSSCSARSCFALSVNDVTATNWLCMQLRSPSGSSRKKDLKMPVRSCTTLISGRTPSVSAAVCEKK